MNKVVPEAHTILNLVAANDPRPKRNLLAKALPIAQLPQRSAGAIGEDQRHHFDRKSSDLASHSALTTPAKMSGRQWRLASIRLGQASATGLAKNALAAAALPITLLIQPSAQADQVPVTVGANTYWISYAELSYNSNSAKFNTPTMPWWGDSSLASQFATAVGDKLGGTFLNEDNKIGPLFGWTVNGERIPIYAWVFYLSNSEYSSEVLQGEAPVNFPFPYLIRQQAPRTPSQARLVRMYQS